ncbi:hypothetical protein MTX78_03390 [Hymenobacter tibetensis]|uniref:Uncharacterized protein n=1 Tax=Hymenobacter tibetensis TaxID=497967 RepID=A0ABY4D0S2_9BACT|nr:hypothetical protein [Hymenobacter tibetensis]UOG75642.1 hypothetical protein MTX78_03390 [Hymenobacter tibetensis]
MKDVKQFLRMVGLVAMLLLAAAGVGLTGAAPIHQKRERFIDTEPKTEQVDKKSTQEDKQLGQE